MEKEQNKNDNQNNQNQGNNNNNINLKNYCLTQTNNNNNLNLLNNNIINESNGLDNINPNLIINEKNNVQNNNNNDSINNNNNSNINDSPNSKNNEYKKLYYRRRINSSNIKRFKGKDKLNIQIFLGNYDENQLFPTYIFNSKQFFYEPQNYRHISLKKRIYNIISKFNKFIS